MRIYMDSLNAKQKRYLRGLAHNRKPVVIVGGAGLSESVLAEISQNLGHHELIKVKINAADRHERAKMIETICEDTGAALVFTIGHVAVFYRPAEKPQIQLPH
jgi:RNA-binding protein